ncbi:hypothetical protein ELH44_09460 [Rhizobium ruizarguesonis]|uniref:hypothetical protein n=1 Tax=Rhizobium ruizarguesonis TaxID=2081791 RepID=UPI00102F9916|nr:hypothetical protein [Rhizobium ruizarguesonis]TBB53881.1 hypothetical protein ELH44_09460 [Rhizobium ruizarguesonis]
MTRSIHKLLVALLLVQNVGQSAEAHAKDGGRAKAIKIVTVTEEGKSITAKIRIKSYPDPENDAYVLRSGEGFKVISVDKCNDLVSISAISETIGIIRKTGDSVPDWLPCTEPELTFNDFVIVPLTLSISNPEFKQTEFWSKTLGKAAVEMRPELPRDIADAFAKQEYGKISIIASELEKSIREAGKVDEADFLYSIALDAGARGVLMSASQNVDPTMADILEYSTNSHRFELKADVMEAVQDYQIKNLGLAKESKALGKFTWETMKSLPGGDNVYAPQYQLRPSAAEDFNGEFLQGLQQPQF